MKNKPARHWGIIAVLLNLPLCQILGYFNFVLQGNETVNLFIYFSYSIIYNESFTETICISIFHIVFVNSFLKFNFSDIPFFYNKPIKGYTYGTAVVLHFLLYYFFSFLFYALGKLYQLSPNVL